MQLDKFLNFDPETGLTSLILVAVAYVLALPIGYNRERQDNSAGIRTFPLIAAASCAFMVLANGIGDQVVLGRVMAGVITGLGFLGGGVILKKEDKVNGMSTAVSIWVTGAVGIATGLGRIEIAILIATVCFLSLRYGKVVDVGSVWKSLPKLYSLEPAFTHHT